MSGKRLVGLIVFVVTLVVSDTDVGMPNTARTDDCLTAPNSSAPQGTHWYYHVDRTNQRKCWYVRATSQPAQQGAAQATSQAAPAAQSDSMPVSSGPMPATAAASAPTSISPGNSAPPCRTPEFLPSGRLRPPSARQRTNLFREAGRKEVPGRQFQRPRLQNQARHCRLTLRRLGRRRPLLRHGPLRSGRRSPARPWPMPARSPSALKRTLRCPTEQRALPGACRCRCRLG